MCRYQPLSDTDFSWSFRGVADIEIQEAAGFDMAVFSLWGTRGIIAPEICYKFSVEPGEMASWERRYISELQYFGGPNK